MPELPRSWPLRLGGSTGTIHSTCSCTSPYFSLVWIEPDLGAITISPLLTGQSAGPPFRPSQLDKSWPLNSTTASEGAAPTAAPGVTCTGTGDQVSVSSGFTLGLLFEPWASASAGRTARAAINFFISGPSP